MLFLTDYLETACSFPHFLFVAAVIQQHGTFLQPQSAHTKVITMKRSNTNSSSANSQALESGFLSKNLVNNELIRRLKVCEWAGFSTKS
jgi:hypothetical protein